MKADTNKCAHPGCNCRIPEGKTYCSDECAAADSAKRTTENEEECECGHADCEVLQG